jgi:uncharacterized membrane protein
MIKLPINAEKEPGTFRILGIDLIRFVSFYAILVFHLSYGFWGEFGHMDVAVDSRWLDPFEIYARALVFSGFTIVFISFFLYGLKPAFSRKWNYLWILLLIFLVVWTYATEEVTDTWDIYQFLLATVFAIALVKAIRIPIKALALFSFTLVNIPFWKLEGLWPALSPRLEAALWGNCLGHGTMADWPLLPWIAYPLLGFSVGVLVRENRADFDSMSRAEGALWALALLAAIPFMGAYYVTPLGTDFGCYVFRRPPLEFWAHQIWIWFFVRVSLTNVVQERLVASRAAAWISRCQVNRRFFLVYFLHFPLVFLCSHLAQASGSTYRPWAYIVSYFTIVVLLEGLPVVIGKFSAKIKL